jgi:SAM-dependent MidA family methyltransferase
MNKVCKALIQEASNEQGQLVAKAYCLPLLNIKAQKSPSILVELSADLKGVCASDLLKELENDSDNASN